MADTAYLAQEQDEPAMLRFSHEPGVRPRKAACSHCDICGDGLEDHRREYCRCIDCQRACEAKAKQVARG